METTITSPTVAKRRREPPSTLMHWTRLAPELSATSRKDCVWIISDQPLCWTRDQAADDEALLGRERTMLFDLHAITSLVLVGLVVRLVLLTDTHVLLVHVVALEAHHLDHHRLVHLVARDATDELAAVDRVTLVGFGLAHDLAPLEARSLSKSSMRAMSLRLLLIRLVSSS